jgi:hypothetical protein
MANKKKNPHYVNNKDLFAAMVEYGIQVKEAEEANEPRPRPSEYIGESIMKIATHLSFKPNFVNYPFVQEMIGDGIENCLQYIDNFNPEKSKNPFAYFTQIIYFAFLRRIEKEKKQLYTKYKATERANVLGVTSDTQEHDSQTSYNDDVVSGEWSQQHIEKFITDFEESKRTKKLKKDEKERQANLDSRS